MSIQDWNQVSSDSMRAITWNIHGAQKDSLVWKWLLDKQPDVVLLQEIGSISDEVLSVFKDTTEPAINKKGKQQRFSTGILVKGEIIEEINLFSEYKCENKELKDFLKGNFIGYVVQPKNYGPLHIVSVYSPAWSVNKNWLQGIDVSAIQLKGHSKVWGTELIWSALKHTVSNNETWIVGGDYNSSETFDKDWQHKHGVRFGIRSSGNREIIDRMIELGFTECLSKFNNNEIVPTYQNKTDLEIVHQMDHLYVINSLYAQLTNCYVGDKSIIFDKLSDHLPIIADFQLH